jgi:hypothetical protein
MKQIFSIIKSAASLLAIVFSLLPSTTYSQIDFEKMKAPELANYWLNKNCDNGEEEIALKRIKNLASEIEPLFIRAYQNGPDAQQISLLEKNATTRFEMIQNSLKSGQTFGLTKDELDLARKQTLSELLANEKKNYINSYKSQSIIALAYTAGPEARKILDTESKNEKSEFNSTAKYAQKKLMVTKD